MSVFEKLKNGESVDMMSEEYRPAIEELLRADRALFHLNHAEPQSEEQKKAFEELFDGPMPEGLSIFTPTQVDYPNRSPSESTCSSTTASRLCPSAGSTSATTSRSGPM